jgi:hypothetical protein
LSRQDAKAPRPAEIRKPPRRQGAKTCWESEVQTCATRNMGDDLDKTHG